MADLILSIVGTLADYVAVPTRRQFSYLFRYDGNLEEFRRQLRELKLAAGDVKLRVEAAEKNGDVILPSVEDWLKRVDAGSDESQRFVEEEDAISKCCFNGPFNLKVRYQRSRKAKKKAAEFDRFKEEGRFDAVAVPAPPPQITFMNNENEFDFESRRSVFNGIMDTIKDDEVEMVGIWGMPGIGKTTLVKRVAKYAKDEGLFEVVAMAVVSQNPNVKDIQDGIADRIGFKFTCETEEERADQLLGRLLAMDKILVILDNLWDCIELYDIGIPSGIQHKGCKVILTSRDRGVCEEMRTGKNFKIDLLSANEAHGLFLQMSGVDNRSSEKGRLAKKLSEECGRLPVSIVIVAKALLNKELFYWTDMLNRLRNSDPNNRVRATIELSYNIVEREEEKMFFLLCALFPEDYKVPVRVLFEYGIGLNLFEKVDNVDQALERAHKLASSLKSSRLLLDEGSDEGSDEESEKFVKMHDVVRDVALAIASKGKNAFLVRPVAQRREWKKKTAISLWNDDVKKLPAAAKCPQLQILMLSCWYSNWQLREYFFTGMKNLIVLDMSGMEFVRLPRSFTSLKNLRTLRFSSCELVDISIIGKLQNLVSLSFYYSNIKVLPKEVGELSNLTLLDLSGCERLKVITPGVIQNLSHLEVLLMRRSLFLCEDYGPENATLSELIHLSHLMILEIHIPDASMLPDELLFGNLTKFKISIGKDCFKMEEGSQFLKLKCISENDLTKAGIKMLMKKAQHLELEDVLGISVALPSHLGGFRTLKELIISHCKDVNYVLDMNELEYEPETPSLQLLHLIDLPLLKEISRGKFQSMFVSELEQLRLFKLPCLVHLWKFDAKSMTLANLTLMSVKSCDKLEYVFEHRSAKSLLKLKKLQVGKCRNLLAICLTKEHDNVITFPRLSHLKLSKLENLTSFGSKFTSESTLFGEQAIFRALENLDINHLEKLEKIWHIHSPVESFFQLKVLKLIQCQQLLVVFPPQAILALQNLEKICIKSCDKLEILVQSDDVPLTGGDEMILFPQLLTLKLVNLPKFTTILSTTSQNISRATVIFCALEELHINNLEKLEKIWHIHSPVKSFFQLKVLKLAQCPQLLVVFPALTTSALQNLEEICIENCDKLETLVQSDDVPLTVGDEIILFPQLLTLKLINLPKFIAILSTTSQNISQTTVIFRALEKLHINNLKKLEKIWHIHSPVELFFQLKVLKLTQCPQLIVVFPAQATSALQNLEEICIKNCDKLETLVQSDDVPLTVGDEMILFPQLLTLKLVNLPKFTTILSTTSQNISQVTMKTFTSMTGETPEPSYQNFTSEALFGQQVLFGRLRHLTLRRVDLVEEIWHRDHPATNAGELSQLEVVCCDRLLKIFPSNLLAGLQKLERLCVKSCASVEHVFAVKDHPPFLSNLQHLILDNLPKLKHLWWNENTCESFGLPSLRFFWMKNCPALQYVFDASVANHLENLRSLFVWNCSSIVEIVEEKPGRKSVFPLLDTLYLLDLPCFKGLNQYVEFPQVRKLVVDGCLNMKVRYPVNVRLVRDIQLQGSMSFFESLVECWKTGMLAADAE